MDLTAALVPTGIFFFLFFQFIKVFDFNGNCLNTIRYHDGFLGQRIGPVSSLAFHPTKPLLAAGATDSIVSIYSTTD